MLWKKSQHSKKGYIMRSGNAERKTKETDIKVSVILDGKGNADI